MRYVLLIAVVLTTSLASAQESYLHAQFRREGERVCVRTSRHADRGDIDDHVRCAAVVRCRKVRAPYENVYFPEHLP